MIHVYTYGITDLREALELDALGRKALQRDRWTREYRRVIRAQRIADKKKDADQCAAP